MKSVKIGDIVKYTYSAPEKNYGIVIDTAEIDLKKISKDLRSDELSQMLEYLAADSLEDLDDLQGVKVAWDSGEITTSYIADLKLVFKN